MVSVFNLREKKILAIVQTTKNILPAQSGSNVHAICAPFVPETNNLYLQIKSKKWCHFIRNYSHYLFTLI